MRRLIVLLLPSAAVLGACTPVDYGFGETTRWNMEQQVVDPDPEYAGNVMEGGSGERGAAAVRRYNSGQVRQSASTGARGSSSSSSSSSGASSSTSGGPQ